MTICKPFWLAIALSAFGCATACSSAPKPNPRAGCTDADLAKLEAAYIARAAEACAGSTYDTCGVLEEIRREYAAKREAWRKCE